MIPFVSESHNQLTFVVVLWWSSSVAILQVVPSMILLCSQDMASEASTLVFTGKWTLRLASLCGSGFGNCWVLSTIVELPHAHLLLLATSSNFQDLCASASAILLACPRDEGFRGGCWLYLQSSWSILITAGEHSTVGCYSVFYQLSLTWIV